jgi:hypothetical protein
LIPAFVSPPRRDGDGRENPGPVKPPRPARRSRILPEETPWVSRGIPNRRPPCSTSSHRQARRGPVGHKVGHTDARGEFERQSTQGVGMQQAQDLESCAPPEPRRRLKSRASSETARIIHAGSRSA